MEFIDKIYRLASRFYFKNIRNTYKELLKYSPLKIESNRFLGFVLVFGLLFSFATAFLLAGFFDIPFLIVFILSFIITQFIAYIWLVLYADLKAKLVENILPDALQLIASNLRAGLTTERAILGAARREFGPLEAEINRIGKKIATGQDLGTALIDMSNRIRSRTLKKTMELIRAGLESGGALAILLEKSAENLREQQMVDKRIRSNVLMYLIFIFVAVGLGAPLLFGLSSFLVMILSNTLSQIDIPEVASAQIQVPLTISNVTIDPAFIVTFAVVFIITNAIFGSLILGLISKGKEREGIKYMPVLIGLALAVFFTIRWVLSNMFSELFGF